MGLLGELRFWFRTTWESFSLRTSVVFSAVYDPCGCRWEIAVVVYSSVSSLWVALRSLLVLSVLQFYYKLGGIPTYFSCLVCVVWPGPLGSCHFNRCWRCLRWRLPRYCLFFLLSYSSWDFSWDLHQNFSDCICWRLFFVLNSCLPEIWIHINLSDHQPSSAVANLMSSAFVGFLFIFQVLSLPPPPVLQSARPSFVALIVN